jgi:hypothetical protein
MIGNKTNLIICNYCPLYRKSDLCIPEIKVLGLLHNFYIHVSVSDLYIPRISLPIGLQQNMRTDPENK